MSEYGYQQPTDQTPVRSFCSGCGEPLQSGSQFCTKCGRAVQGDTLPPMNKKEFIRQTYGKTIRNNAILCYVCAGLTCVINLFLNPFGIIDGLLLLGLALGMHLSTEKGFAIAILVLACVEVIVSLVLTMSIGPWLWVVAGISSVSAFSKAEKQFKQRQQMQF